MSIFAGALSDRFDKKKTMLFCDLLARSLFAPTEMSISSMTAVFGAPVVIAMLIGRKKR